MDDDLGGADRGAEPDLVPPPAEAGAEVVAHDHGAEDVALRRGHVALEAERLGPEVHPGLLVGAFGEDGRDPARAEVEDLLDGLDRGRRRLHGDLEAGPLVGPVEDGVHRPGRHGAALVDHDGADVGSQLLGRCLHVGGSLLVVAVELGAEPDPELHDRDHHQQP